MNGHHEVRVVNDHHEVRVVNGHHEVRVVNGHHEVRVVNGHHKVRVVNGHQCLQREGHTLHTHMHTSHTHLMKSWNRSMRVALALVTSNTRPKFLWGTREMGMPTSLLCVDNKHFSHVSTWLL